MKKITILLIALMVISVGFLSGCEEIPNEIVEEMIIVTFIVEPSLIEIGETANLSWVVTGINTTITIDNGIGNISLTGTRIIIPSETTTYTLTAVNTTTTLTATTVVIVNEPTEPVEPDETTSSLAMNIFDRDTSQYLVIWMVSQVEGPPVADNDYWWALLDTSGQNVTGATLTFNDNNNDNYVNPGDTFAVNTTSSGSYVLILTQKSTDELLFNSASTIYEKQSSTIAMNIFDRDTSQYLVIWMVSQVEGGTVANDEYDWTLSDTNGVSATGATLTFHDNNNDNYVNSGDTFAVTAPHSGTYVFTLSDKDTGEILFKSAQTYY